MSLTVYRANLILVRHHHRGPAPKIVAPQPDESYWQYPPLDDVDAVQIAYTLREIP